MMSVVDDETNLVSSAGNSDDRRLRVFIDNGMSLDGYDGQSRRKLLEFAIRYQEYDVAWNLVSAGVEFGDVNRESIILGALSNEASRSAAWCLERSDSVLRERVVSHQSNPLAIAAKANRIRAVEVLLDHGADLEKRDADQKSPLHHAVANGNKEMIRLLMRHGVRFNLAEQDSRTIFDIAMHTNQLPIARLLLELDPQDYSYMISERVLSWSKSLRFTTDGSVVDAAINKRHFYVALKLLETGAESSSRRQRIAQTSGSSSLVGSGNEYLRSLCENIIAFERSQEITTDTGSDQTFLCASEWLLTCLTQHEMCIQQEGPLPLLPSRVLDVGPTDGSQRPYLMVTQGKRGRYIALSHRWGGRINKTMTLNITQRISGLDASDLTKTMDDAVTITRKLGMRYLWIDAICIIQDSHSDWSVESCNMANIYRNALLTIAAAAASDHAQGCFSDRNESRPGSVLDTRGWILQEQLLSQRVLKYGFGHISWECMGLCANESNPKVGTIPSEAAHFKNALARAKPWQAHASWLQIVRSYSYRKLTKEADKLNAVMGIANFTGDILRDTFLAGLWQTYLHEDLLWSSSDSYGGTRLTSISLPSWSWASMKGRISYDRPRAEWRGASWERVSGPMGAFKVVSAEVDRNVSNGDVRGKLYVRGSLSKVHRGTGSLYESTHLYPESVSPEPVPDPDTGSHRKAQPESSSRLQGMTSKLRMRPDKEKLRLKRNAQVGLVTYSPPPNHELDSSHDFRSELSLVFKPDVESESFSEAWLLAIASDAAWTHFLVIVPVDDEPAVYRRVGLCHVENVKTATLQQAEHLGTLVLN